MSFISDQLRALDLQLHRLQLGYPAAESTVEPSSTEKALFHSRDEYLQLQETSRIQLLKRIIQNLSSAIANLSSHAGPPISTEKLLQLLKEAAITQYEEGDDNPQKVYERELEWLLLGKVVILAYGITLHTLLTQTLPLAEDLFYWDGVLSSYQYTILYAIQILPVWVVDFLKEIYRESMKRLHQEDNVKRIRRESWSSSMIKFYGLVRNSLRDHSREWHRRILVNTPFYVIRYDVQKKQSSIRQLREIQACALGVLLGETLNIDYGKEPNEQDWKKSIGRAALLMESIFRNLSSAKQLSVAEFEKLIFRDSNSFSRQDASEEGTTSLQASLEHKRAIQTWAVSQHVHNILSTYLPAQEEEAKRLRKAHGRPGVVVRYWAPITVLLLTSSTTLKYITSRKAELRVWIQEAAVTMIDFWKNWVIEPTKRILATIRHDADSEVALMSRRSLNADMESLERMVVEFALDHPEVSLEGGTHSLGAEEIEAIRQRVKEGDLTLILRAYERDLRRPFKGTVMGELLRTLLIQIQKTKVDVEVAISGIDSLLESQQLLFAFLGLTPGILTTWAITKWLAGALGGRKYVRRGQDSESIIRILRNIDRILSNASGGDTGVLSYKEQGLVLCEVYVLRELAIGCLPRHIYGAFIEETEELANKYLGIKRQFRALDRLRWAYSRWIH